MEVTFSQAKAPEPPKPVNIKPPVVLEPPLEPQEPRETPAPEEIKEATKELYESMGWGKAPANISVQPAKEPDPEPSAPAPEAPAEPTPPAPEPEPEPEAPTAQQIATETAREVGREIVKELRRDEPPRQPTPPPAPSIDLSPEDSADLKVIRYLEREEPATYRGTSQKFLDYVKKHYDYQAEWLKANEGKEFDADDADHAKWYADNQPDIDPQAIEQGRIDMAADERFEKKYGAKLKEQEAKEAYQREAPNIAAKQTQKVHEMVTMADPELGKLVTGPNGQPLLTDETIKALETKDPIAYAIYDKIVREELDPMISELEKTAVTGMNYKFDPARNATHGRIAQFISGYEKDMAKAPRSAQVLNGAQWIPLGEYNRRISEINQSAGSEHEAAGRIDELNRSYWAISIDMAEALITDYCAQKAKRLIAEEDARAKKKYGRTETPVAAAPVAAPARPSALPPNPNGKPRSPAIGGQPQVTTAPKVGSAGAKSYGETAVDVNFSR
jgi:hypothetical protein